jgi:vitamin B12 transporter
MKKFFLFLSFSIFLFSHLNFSQEKIVEKTDVQRLYKLSEVVISATKTQANTLELASSVTVIDSAEIANRNSSNAFDLLKNEYGISFTRQGGPGTLSNISIRGGNSNHTLVLIDGVEANLNNDPANVYDFAFLSANNIQSIEILRGPQSTLYGSNSLAGVINVITRKGNGKPSFSLLVEAGSYKSYKTPLGMNGSVETSLGMNGSLSDFNYSVTLGRSESDGFSAASEKYGNKEKDGYRKDNMSSRFGYNFGLAAELNFFMNYNKSESDYDQHGGKYGDDSTYIFNQEEFSFHGEGKLNLFEGKWNQIIGVSIFGNIRKYNFDYSEFNAASSKSYYDGRRIKLDWQSNFNLVDNHLIILGLETIKDEAISEYYYHSDFFSSESLFPTQSSNTFGIYLQDQFKIDQNFFSTVGIRLDKHDKFGSAFTFRIAPAYIFWQTSTKLKATLGSGYKAPSLFNLYDPAYGNPDLKPEKSVGFDAGFEQFFGNDLISLGITYFQNDYKDLLGYDENFRTININKAKTNGVETYINAKIVDDLEIKMNYTFTNAKDESEGLAENERKLIRRPEHKIGGYISYNVSAKLNTNIEVIYVGKRDDLIYDNFTFTSSRTQLNPYVLLNFAAHYKLFDFVRINLRLENILDSDYEEVYGYATPGFSIYGGIKLSLDYL